MKGVECINKECYYLHEIADKNDIINKNESQTKFQFLEQQKIATKIADIYSPEQKSTYIKKGSEMKKELEKIILKVIFLLLIQYMRKNSYKISKMKKRELMNIIAQIKNIKKIIVISQVLLIIQILKKTI